MPTFRTGVVTSITAERRGLQRITVDGEPAYVLTQLVGDVAVGDRVVVNTTAVQLGLGTGGNDIVHWNLARRDWSEPGPGHVLKLRYTSLQTDTGVAEEAQESPGEDQLEGMPVVACGLHSQLAAVSAAFKAVAPERRLVYVMTDGGALPIVISDLVHDLRSAGLIDATVTAGHSFGGDLEAVNVWSALAVARHRLEADAVVAAIGPGVVGTGTRLGHTGLDVTAVIDATAALGGRPIVAARHSAADARRRHLGRSHHTATALELAHAADATAVPDPDDLGQELPDVIGLLAAKGIPAASMGRPLVEDPPAWRWPAAAGVAAARAATTVE